MKQSIFKLSGLISLILVFFTSTANAQNAATEISIPSIGITASIVNAPFSNNLGTWDVSALNMTVGHLEYTPWFGENSNILLAGHSLSLAGQADIFYQLDLVQVGDEINIQDNGTSYRYIVSETFTIEETDISIINPTAVETLTIFTCDTSSYSDGAYRRRHVVRAVRAS